MKNYSNTIIYKIYCIDTSVNYLYIDSTINMKVKRSYHKNSLLTKPNCELSMKINENGGWTNWKMEEIEKYDCKSREEALEREKYWFDLITSSKIPHSSSKNPQNLLKNLESSSEFTQISSKIPHFSNEKNDVKPQLNINVLECIYCNKIYSRKDNLKRHLQTCKSKQVYDEKMEIVANNEIITINQNLQNNLQNKNTMLPNNSQLTTNSMTNSNNTMMSNSNNITTINHITQPVTVIPLGKENLVEFFSDEEQIKILKKMFGCFIYLIEYVHFSGKFPQFANIRINNLRSNIAYIYNDDDKRFNAYDQNEVIAEVISERLMDITNFFENVKEKLSTKESQKIQQLISDIEEQQARYKEYLKKVKLMMYNKRHMVNTTL